MDVPSSLVPSGFSPAAPKHHARYRLGVIVLAVAAAHLGLLQGLPAAQASTAATASPVVPITQAPPELPATPVFNTRTVVQSPPAAPLPRVKSAQKPPPALTPIAQEAIIFVANQSVNDADLQLAAADTGPATEPAAAPAASTPPKPSGSAPTSPVQNYVFPPSARLGYEVKGESKSFPYSYVVDGEIVWTQDGHNYDAKMEFRHFLLGSRTQTSKGQLTALGLEPTRFGDKVRNEVAAHFERAKGKVIFSANTPEATLLPGAQDHLSVIFQLASMFGGAPTRFGPGSSIAFQAVGPRSAESWVFVVGQTEKLKLPGGDVNAIKLVRDPNGQYDTRLELWLAPHMAYLPVRIKLTESNGNSADQRWRETKSP